MEARPTHLTTLRIQSQLALANRFILGIVLLVSATAHLQNEMAFYSVVLQYSIVPISLAGTICRFLPWLQVVTAAALISRRWQKAALLLATALFIAFTAAQFIVYFQGGAIRCGCFGMLEDETIGLTSIGRNLILISMSLAGLLYAIGSIKKTTGEPRERAQATAN